MAHMSTALTNAEYRQVKAYSKSDLDFITKSPALVEWARNCPTDGSPAVDKGTDLHCALLEPLVFESDYIRAPDYDLKTTKGRIDFTSFTERMESVGKKVMTATDYDKLIAMRDSVLAHPTAKALLTGGVSEASIFWELDGLKLKARPDKIADLEVFGPMLVDVKKIDDIENILRAINKRRYHVQAAFYSDAYEQLTDKRPRFVFIFVGERREIGRHPVRVLELPSWKVEEGREAYLADLDVVREIEEFGSGLDIELLDIPQRQY